MATVAGQVLSGLAVPQGDRVVLLLSDGTKATLEKGEIESETASLVSLMPEGLLDNLSKAEIADLLRFLETGTTARTEGNDDFQDDAAGVFFLVGLAALAAGPGPISRREEPRADPRRAEQSRLAVDHPGAGAALDKAGRFAVRWPRLPGVQTPGRARRPWRLTAPRWNGSRPSLDRFDVLVNNYNGDPWPEAFRRSFVEHVRLGKLGLVIVHAANHPFADWAEFNRMMGLGWREDPRAGAALKVEDDGTITRVPVGEGSGRNGTRRSRSRSRSAIGSTRSLAACRPDGGMPPTRSTTA